MVQGVARSRRNLAKIPLSLSPHKEREGQRGVCYTDSGVSTEGRPDTVIGLLTPQPENSWQIGECTLSLLIFEIGG